MQQIEHPTASICIRQDIEHLTASINSLLEPLPAPLMRRCSGLRLPRSLVLLDAILGNPAISTDVAELQLRPHLVKLLVRSLVVVRRSQLVELGRRRTGQRLAV
jgi:hypothetical protein